MTAERTLVDTLAAAAATGVSPATVRSWARRGHLTQRGVDEHRRVLYDLGDVYSCAKQRRTSKGGRPRKTTAGS